MTPQLAGWVGSALCALMAYLPLHRAGVDRLAALAWASLFFFTPLAFLLNGGNSVLMFSDLVYPLLFLRVLTRPIRGQTHRLPWSALVLGGGLLPLLSAVSYQNNSTDVLITFANLYRVCGIAAAAVVFRSSWQDEYLPALVRSMSLVAIALIVIMGLQSLSIVETNFFESTWNSRYFNLGIEYADRKFVVLGMFKAAQGIIWMSLCLFGLGLLGHPDRAVARAGLMLAALSLVPLVLTGSKTSIIAAFIGLAAGVVLLRSGKVAALFSVVVIAFGAFVAYVQATPDSRQFVNSTLYDAIVSSGTDLETADSRLVRYYESYEAIDDNPLILLGLHSSRSIPYNSAYFHSEYLSVLMLGGVLGFGLYLYFIGRTTVGLMRSFRLSPGARGPTLVLVGNLVQALTVGHMQPNFLFTSSAMLAACLYAIGIPKASVKQPARQSRRMLRPDGSIAA